MKRFFAILPLVAGFAFVASAALGQYPSQPEMLYVHHEVVHPSKVMEHEAATREFAAAVKAHSDAEHKFNYTAIATTEFDYYYVLPMKSFAGIDALNAFFAHLSSKMGKEKFDALMAKGSATLDHTAEVVAMRRPDLSYIPKTPRLKPEEVKFIRYEFYYVSPGTESKVEAISKEWAALFERHNVSDGFTLYQVLMGDDLPLVVVTVEGTSPADLETQNAKILETLGKEGTDLMQRTLALTRRFETKVGQIRLDLSNPPAAPTSN
jgi:hypothetical protein